MAWKRALLFAAVIAVCLIGAAGIVTAPGNPPMPGFGLGTLPGGDGIGDGIGTGGDTTWNGGPSDCKWGTLCICDSVDKTGTTLTCKIDTDKTIFDEDSSCDATKKNDCFANVNTFWQLKPAGYTKVIWKFTTSKSIEFTLKDTAGGVGGKIFGSPGTQFDIEISDASVLTRVGNFSIKGVTNLTLDNGSMLGILGGDWRNEVVEMDSIAGDLKLYRSSVIGPSFRGSGGVFSANNIIVEDSAIGSESDVVGFPCNGIVKDGSTYKVCGKVDGVIIANNTMRLKGRHCDVAYDGKTYCEDPLGGSKYVANVWELGNGNFIIYGLFMSREGGVYNPDSRDYYIDGLWEKQKLNFRIEAGRLEMENTNLKISYDGEEIHADELDMTDSQIECVGLYNDDISKGYNEPYISYDCSMSVTGNAKISGRHSNRYYFDPTIFKYSGENVLKKSIDAFKSIDIGGNLAMSATASGGAYIYNLGKTDDCWAPPEEKSTIGNTPLQENALKVGGKLTMANSRIDGWSNVGISAGSANLQDTLENVNRNDDVEVNSLNYFTLFPYGSTDGKANNDYDDKATLWNIAKFKVGTGVTDDLEITGAKLMRMGYAATGLKAVEVSGKFTTNNKSWTHCETGCEISACSAYAGGAASTFEARSTKGGQSLGITTCPAVADDNDKGENLNVSAGALTVKCETGNDQCGHNIKWNGTPTFEKNTDCGKCGSEDFKCKPPMTATPPSQTSTGKFPTTIKAEYTSPIGTNNISIDCSDEAENQFPTVTKNGSIATADCIFKALAGNPDYKVHKVTENYCGTIDVPHGTPYCYGITAVPDYEPEFEKEFPSTITVKFKGKPTAPVTVNCGNGTTWKEVSSIKDGSLAGEYYIEGKCNYVAIKNYDCVLNHYDNQEYPISVNSETYQNSSCNAKVYHGTCLDKCSLEPKQVKNYSGAAFTKNFTYTVENPKSNFEGYEVEADCGNGNPAYSGNPANQKITISGGKADFTCSYDKCESKTKVCVYRVTASIKKSGVSDYCHADATVSYGEPGCIFGPYDVLTGLPTGWSNNEGTPAYVQFYMSDKYESGDKVSLWCKGTDNPASTPAFLKKNKPGDDWGYVQWYITGSASNNCDPCKKDTTLRAVYDNKGMTFDCTTLCQNTTTPQPECGNGTREGAEECDKPDLDNKQCSDFTDSTGKQYQYGDLACTGGCKLDKSGCGYCGDGDIDAPYEQCDGTGCKAGETCSNSCFCTGGGTDKDVSVSILNANPPRVVEGKRVMISAGIENSYSESKTLDVKFEIKNTTRPGVKEKTCYEQVAINPPGGRVEHSFGGSGGFGIMHCGEDIYFDNVGDKYEAIVTIDGIEPPEADDDTSNNYKDDVYFEIVAGLRPPEVLEDCFDGIDNDGDGLVDCADTSCPCPSGTFCDKSTPIPKCLPIPSAGYCGDGISGNSTGEQCDPPGSATGNQQCVNLNGTGSECAAGCICTIPGGGGGGGPGTGGGFIPELPIFFVPAMLGAVLAIIFLGRRK